MVGMGQDLFGKYSCAKSIFDEADDALGFSISKIIFDGSDEELSKTINAQPAILTSCMAAMRVLQMEYGFSLNKFSFMAGHSLGEYSALCASGVLSFQDSVKLVAKRASLMSNAPSGRMLAIIGMPVNEIEAILSCGIPGICEIANENSDDQTVLSGDSTSIEFMKEKAVAMGAKKCIELNVSIASHCSLMKDARDELKTDLKNVHFAAPCVPIVTNISGLPQMSEEILKDHLIKQMTGRLLWNKTMTFFLQTVSCVVEIGPSGVLSKISKRQAGSVPMIPVFSDESMCNFIASVAELEKQHVG